MKEDRKPEYPEKTPDGELKKKSRILKPKYSSFNRDSNPHSSIQFGGKLEKQTC